MKKTNSLLNSKDLLIRRITEDLESLYEELEGQEEVLECTNPNCPVHNNKETPEERSKIIIKTLKSYCLDHHDKSFYKLVLIDLLSIIESELTILPLSKNSIN